MDKLDLDNIRIEFIKEIEALRSEGEIYEIKGKYIGKREE